MLFWVSLQNWSVAVFHFVFYSSCFFVLLLLRFGGMVFFIFLQFWFLRLWWANLVRLFFLYITFLILFGIYETNAVEYMFGLSKILVCLVFANNSNGGVFVVVIENINPSSSSGGYSLGELDELFFYRHLSAARRTQMSKTWQLDMYK